MTNEEKQALIEACEDTIKYAKDYPSHEVEMAKAALITLTAQPIKLPHHVTNVTNKFYEEGRDDVIAAIRAAGYEVQE